MYAIISDFDGTITDDDLFTYTSRAYFGGKEPEPWVEYHAGKKTHFNALNEIYGSIHVSEDELKKVINQVKIDSCFQKTLDLCAKKNMPIYIVSAGCDYYIKELIGAEIKKYNITLITNKGTYTEENGLKMIAPDKSSPYYNEAVGISKKAVVEELIKKGYKVIFAGDGAPDVEPAKVADIVFAKKFLLQKCIEQGIKTQKFESFQNIYDFLNKDS